MLYRPVKISVAFPLLGSAPAFRFSV